jgi:hypothetical protein
MVATMSDFDAFDDHFMPDSDAQHYTRDTKRALIHGTQMLLRNESEAWRDTCLPAFAAMAAQLRRDAEQRADDARPRLELALRFEELAMQPPHEAPKRDDDEGPY